MINTYRLFDIALCKITLYVKYSDIDGLVVELIKRKRGFKCTFFPDFIQVLLESVEYYETMALGMKRVPIEDVLREVETWPYGINRVQRFIESANLDAVAFGIRTKEIFDELRVDFMEVDNTLSARGNTHGDFRTNSQISQRFKDIAGPYRGKLNDQQSEALDMIFHKIARILAGEPNFKDHWHDIQGYAKLVEERL